LQIAAHRVSLKLFQALDCVAHHTAVRHEPDMKTQARIRF
jgi:hypothetical protein